MRKLILLACLFLSSSVYGQTNNPFPYLTEVVNSGDTAVHLYIDKSKAEIINKKLKDLDKNHPLYTHEDCESEMTLLSIAKIDNTDKKYAVVYGNCPEPEFHFYGEDDISKFYGAVSGLKMYILGNGNLYVTGHVNSNFDLKRKLRFEENNIMEVKQPHYYVGLKTKTLKPVTIYQSKDLKNVVANLPENYNIEVLLAETSYGQEGFYLIKTGFGLVGWTKIKAGQYQSVDVEGVFWNGD